MIRISGLGAKNVRSLKNLEILSLKPLNILVGKNSAGKSTFARLLPLLKQSSERSKQAPILWWGRLVDFGAFEDVYSSLSSDGFIDISVRFEVSHVIFLNRRPVYRDTETPLERNSFIDATFRLSPDEDGRTVFRELHLNIFDVKVVLTLAPGYVSSVTINGEAQDIPSNIRLTWTQGGLLPTIRNINVAPTQSSVSDESLFTPRRVLRFGAINARRAISYFLHGNTQEDRKDEIADRLPIAPAEDFLSFCQKLPGSTVTWKSMIAASSKNSPSLRRLHSSVMLVKLDMLLSILDDAAQRHLAGVSYLEPLRATAQRYYRREEISTDELDPKGLNTPFFIQGLTARERESLVAWTTENFGFSLSVKNSGGHLSLNIQSADSGSSTRNMADVGLGYSQLVPVALQLWAAQRRVISSARKSVVGLRSPNARIGATVVVEQPELHLHPAYQASLADVLAVTVGANVDRQDINAGLTVIAETHSPNLIARLGELVSAGKMNPDLVQILVFEESEDPKHGAKVRIAHFDDDGILRNWPIGFFDA